MQSQGSTSSQPSLDSLSSSDSLLFSDSDNADVFLTDASSSALLEAAVAAAGPMAGGPAAADARAGRAANSPASQWACDGYADKEQEEEDGASPAQNPKSQGDLLFAQKCAELQGFVRPLLELLNGLKKGRFDRGLSSFQQSVAMDRIQRIVGVLQNPNSGARYLNTLLQVEMMLKLWFPQIAALPPSSAAAATSPACPAADATPPHKHRDQLHIPVKKRRLSWTGTDSPTSSPGLPKCPRLSAQEKHLPDDSEEETQTEATEGGPCPPPPAPPLLLLLRRCYCRRHTRILQRETPATLTVRVTCQSTKRLVVLSPASRGCTLPPSCPRGRRARQRRPRRTAPCPPPRPPSTARISRKPHAAKATQPLPTSKEVKTIRTRARPLRPE
ncbi:uncharacterized protein LOC119135603 [Syngnathus acus]|uniref:uncharacterized protein LOC119135603 n=1 Tax=Syngnathus acus TaxID=161584 RepID=UPI00188606A9|nr:uncharacterized protein LOC119135603 [Syngnathus acus]